MGHDSDDSCENCGGNKSLFKTTMLKSSLFDYIDAYILCKQTINNGTNQATKNRQLMFKSWAKLVNWINQTNNTQLDNPKYLDLVVSTFNLL